MSARRGAYWTAVAASAVVLVAGVLLAVLGDSGPAGPSEVVRTYFAALSRSDAPAALALSDGPGGAREFLTSDVLRLQQDIAPLRDLQIHGVDGTGRVQAVRYSYVLDFPTGAQPVTGTAAVTQHGNTWRLRAAGVPVQLDLSAASGRATLAGAAVPDGSVALFPGAVPIRFDTPELQVASGAVTFGAATAVALKVTISSTGREALRAAVTAKLRTCFPADAASLPQCPLPDDPRIVPGSLRGTIDPSGIDHLGYSVESLASGPVRVDGTLSFTGSYRRLDDDNIARARSGHLTLHVRATTPSVGPVRLQLAAAS
jgi:hypothetical protein